MRICPTCHTEYSAHTARRCSRDGTLLIDARPSIADRRDPLVGTTLVGRFRIVARVGTGGMGTVYRAEQVGLARQVALKVLKPELIVERETVARFHREANAMSMLLHANTVRVFDFGEDPATGHLFLAMELLEGEMLTARVDRERNIDLLDVIEIVREILRSLAEAHDKGIIHRDLKPDNIFLAQIAGHAKSVVKVLDFGIAKVFRDDQKVDQLETQAGTVFGTPRYMSPEQAQGRVLDPRSDLYSVGVLLYHLLAGRAPFMDEDAVVVMAKHIRDKPEPLSRAAAGRHVPASLEAVVMRALEKDPGARFATADEFERALADCVMDAVAARHEDDPSLALEPLIARRPSRARLAVGGLLALAAVGVVAVVTTAGTGHTLGGAQAASSSPDETPEAAAPQPPPVEPAVPVEPAAVEEPVAVPAEAPAPPAEPTWIATTAEPQQVTVHSEPEGATVLRAGAELGTTPLTVDVDPASPTLELRREGFRTAEVQLTESATEQTFALERTERGARAQTARVRPRADEVAPVPVPTPAVEPAPRPTAPEPTPARDPYTRFE